MRARHRLNLDIGFAVVSVYMSNFDAQFFGLDISHMIIPKVHDDCNFIFQSDK